ncbi:uncharacterized protein LOC131447913 [Solea solea]|uniref:uncharacterized protein LOC131447913 n=1 Tax=Solea solea TaxID=90069 RepID=UPI00272CCD50|nr:uncharacterized protein LOC131447913 [Solea solea]
MDYVSLSCLICLNKYSKFFEIKNHVCTGQHRQKFKAVFQEEQSYSKAWVPYIGFLNPQNLNQLKVGVSLLTVYYCTESETFFYLCHVCEEKYGPVGIFSHLFSTDHCIKYFCYTDPNLLSFSWMPSMDISSILRPWIIKESIKKESGTLQFLNIPENLKKKFDACSYSEVMDTLRGNYKLLKIFEAVKPQRIMIQTYQKDGNRAHQLLGLQHLVECICVGQTDKRYYLCTLCKQTVATNMIIAHVLSFDHIHSYFEVKLPSTLLPKESYSYSNSLVNTMIDLAKRTDDKDGTANAEMKQVSLDPAEFASVNFTCYEEALQKLESITMEKNGRSLITHKCCSVSVKSEAPLYKLHCQNCKVLFETESKYMKHLSEQTHTRMWEKLKEAVGSQCYEQRVTVNFNLDLCLYLRESMKQNEPVVGVSLVVACVSSRVHVEPIYICFACQNCFPESFLRQHFKSQKHVILTLLYQNPWRLPFAWKSPQDLKALKTMAWEEAKARGPDDMILKAFDIPYSVFHCLIPPNYEKVMKALVLFHVYLMNKVPQCETYSRLQQNERFPLLGKQFLVIHACGTKVGFVCLLCEQTMMDDEFYAHVFSWKHVATFLNRFHPGSLSGNTDTATLLDLAKQAANLHPTSNEQGINLDTPICMPCPYETVVEILEAAKRQHGGGQLEPTIAPRYKLSPRQSLIQVGNNTVRDNTQENSGAVVELEKKNCVKSTDKEDTIEKVSVEPSSKIIIKCSLKSDEASKETPTPCGARPEKTKEVYSKPCPDGVQNAVKETSQRLKEEVAEDTKVQMEKDIKKEVTEECITREQISEVPQSCQNTVGSERTEAEQESSITSKDVPTLRDVVYSNNDRKRPHSSSDKSEGLEGEIALKRQRMNAEEDSPSKKSQNMLCGGQTLTATINQRENIELCQKTATTQVSSDKEVLRPSRLWNYIKNMNREPVIGLSALLECHSDQHNPIYLCQSCDVKRRDSRIISHVSNYEHHKNYMMKIQKISSQQERNMSRKNIRQLAASVEQTEGFGEAQVIDLDENIYQLISSQEFNLAIQTVKEVQAQQDGKHVFLLTSALQDTHSHAEVNFQVEEMDSSDSNSETKPSSVTAPMSVVIGSTSKEVPPESESKVSVSKSVQDASSVHVSKSRTTMARLHSDSTENNSHNKIAQNTTFKPLVTETTSNMLAMCPRNTTMTVSARPVSMSSCTAATTSLGKTTYKCLSATDGTTKLTAGNPSSSANTISASPYHHISLTGTTSTSNVAASGKASTTKPTLSKPLNSTNETWSKMTEEASSKPVRISQTGSTAFHETACMSAHSEKASQTKVTHSKAKTSVTSENNKACAKAARMKTVKDASADIAPRACVSNPPAAPLEAPATSVKSGLVSPSAEPSHTHTMKIKPKENRRTVGFYELILVNCEKRRQVYCKLCSKRMTDSAHTSTLTHQSNYVNKLYGPNIETTHFEKIIAHLAEAEKYAGNRKDQINSQSVEVKNDVYLELAALPDDKAIEKLQDILRQKALQVPSVSTSDNAQVKLQVVGSSRCEVSSPDDGICVPLNQTSGLSVTNQPVQENVHVTESPCASELRSNLKEQADHSGGAPSGTEKGPGPSDLTPEQVQPFLLFKSDPDPIPPPSIQEADTTVLVPVKQERFDPFFDAPAHIEVMPAVQRPVPVEHPQCCAHSIAAHSTHTSLVTSIKQEPLSLDLLRTERENERRPSLTEEHVPAMFVPGPEQHSASVHQVLPRTSEGAANQSCMERLDPEPVIGLGFVWKCRGTSGNTFYLCESCEKTFSTSHIAHVSSPNHWYKYIRWQHPSFMSYWEGDHPLERKLKALRATAVCLSLRESDVTVQDVPLGPELYEHVHRAPFGEALQIAQHIKKEENGSSI